MNLMHKQQKEPCNASNDIWYTRKMYKNMRNIKNTQIILVLIGPDNDIQIWMSFINAT